MIQSPEEEHFELGDRVCASYTTSCCWFCIGLSDLGFANDLRQAKSQVGVIYEVRGKNRLLAKAFQS